MSWYLMGYTREPIDNVIYDPRLAFSLHLAIGTDDRHFRGLNHNSGVLFALATENEDGSLNPMSLRNPRIFRMKDGTFGVIAIRIPADGGDDDSSKGSVLFWSTKDMLVYREMGLLKLCENHLKDIVCQYNPEADGYEIGFTDTEGTDYLAFTEDIATACEKGLKPDVKKASAEQESKLWQNGRAEDASRYVLEDMEGAIPENAIELSDEEADRLRCKLMTPENIGISFPKEISASNPDELKKYKAIASYSDKTTAEKTVDWDLRGVSFDRPGEYRIRGKVHKEHYDFPVAFNRADPCIGFWDGKYYFIATNDADNNHTLYVREADTIPELVNAEEQLILDSSTYEGIGGLLWAPEFHEINGRLYIFHAATKGEFFCEESRLMELREGGSPACAKDWSAPRKIVRKDGSELCPEGRTISLDMTCFEWQGDYYVIWSQREFLPKDLGAWLYIARLNPEEPWKLASDPAVLSKPDYGWGNNHTFVEEGPFALIRGDRLYVTFSAAGVDTSYVVSYLVVEKGKDILDPGAWRKNNYPILTSRSVPGEYGTGHNAYVTDGDGTIWNTYHARPGVEGVRSSGIRRVHFDIDGDPVLDLTEELDLKDEFRDVETRLIIRG